MHVPETLEPFLESFVHVPETPSPKLLFVNRGARTERKCGSVRRTFACFSSQITEDHGLGARRGVQGGEWMPVHLLEQNVVIAANQLNPSIFSQLWLARTGLVREEEFAGGCIYADGVSNTIAREFALLVIPPRLQFSPRVAQGRDADLVREKVGRILELLPQTPYTAMGFNFHWCLVPPDGNLSLLTRQLFYQENRPVFAAFDCPDAAFGTYLSKDALGMRLRLDVKPTVVESELFRGSGVLFQFNFNRNLLTPQNAAAPDVVVQAQEVLQLWPRAKETAADLVRTCVGALPP